MTSSTTTSKVPLVVYQHQPTGVPVIKDGLAVISEAVLKSILEAHPTLRLTKKPIVKGSRHVDIYQTDLWSDGEKDANKDLPNAHTNLAGIKLSFRVVLERLLLNDFEELYILSEKNGSVL